MCHIISKMFLRPMYLRFTFVLTFTLFAAPPDSLTQSARENDSVKTLRNLESTFARKTAMGSSLAIAGLSCNVVGAILPWFLANPSNANNAGVFLGTGLGLVTCGATISCIGTTVIRKWASDHIMDPPETRAWRVYDVGMALMYVGAVGIIAGVGTHNLSTFLDYGLPAFLGGEVLLMVSSIQSVVYTSSVNSKRMKKKYTLVALPTVDIRGGAGFMVSLGL